MDIKSLKIDFTHTAGEVELIIAGLRKLPMELVQELHDKIIRHANESVTEQTKPAETPTEDE